MLTWLLRNVNAGPDFVEHIDEARLIVHQPWTLGVGMAVLVPVAAFLLWWQWQRLRSAPPYLRLLLSFTRIAVLALMVVVLAGPFLKLDHKSEKKPIVALLFDQSQSMRLPAGPFESDGETRQIANAAGYRTADGQIDAQAPQGAQPHQPAQARPDRRRSQHRRCSTRWRRSSTCSSTPSRATSSDSASTRPNQVPRAAQPRRAGHADRRRRFSMCSTRPRAGRSRASSCSATARTPAAARPPRPPRPLAPQRGPIFAVPVGTSNRLQDVAIVDVFTTGLVSVGDTARVAVTIESQGFDKRPVKVELRDGDKVLDTQGPDPPRHASSSRSS